MVDWRSVLHSHKAAPVKSVPAWSLFATIGAACILGYYPVVSAGFLSDDFTIIHALQYCSFADIGLMGIFFRPLTWLSFGIDFHIFGYWAAGYHITNLMLHFIASLGVCYYARLLLKTNTAGLLAGLIFALHPAHPEAVSWIAGRYDVLSGTLFVWAMFFHQRALTEKTGRSLVPLVVSLTLFALACLAKEGAFALPLIVLLCEIYPPAGIRPNGNPTGRLMRIALFFIVGLLLFIVRWNIIGGIGGGGVYAPGEASQAMTLRVLHQVFIQPFIVLLFPINWLIMGQVASVTVVVFRSILLSPLALLVGGIRWRVAVFSVAAIVISNLPTAYAGMSELELFGSRFFYIPSIFFSILIATLCLGNGKSGRWRKAAGIITLIYIIVLLFGLNQNNHPWAETGRLVESADRSIAKLVNAHEGEWGDKYHKLFVYNVPHGHLGAHAFGNGFPEMMQLFHGEEMKGVEIEMTFGGIQSEENINKLKQAIDEGAMIWFFDDSTWTFVEPMVSAK